MGQGGCQAVGQAMPRYPHDLAVRTSRSHSATRRTTRHRPGAASRPTPVSVPGKTTRSGSGQRRGHRHGGTASPTDSVYTGPLTIGALWGCQRAHHTGRTRPGRLQPNQRASDRLYRRATRGHSTPAAENRSAPTATGDSTRMPLKLINSVDLDYDLPLRGHVDHALR